jgi:two-component system, LytTR family, sensor histidine kinase AlgZ
MVPGLQLFKPRVNDAPPVESTIERINQFICGPLVFSEHYRLWRHVMYWSIHILLWALFWKIMGPSNISYGLGVFNMILWVPVFILFSYPMVYLAVPHLLLQGKFWQFMLVVLLWGVFGLFINLGFRNYLYGPLEEWFGLSYLPQRMSVAESYLCMATSAASPMIIKFFKLWTMKQQELIKMKVAKNKADLQLLKAQVHPEFFFQTLASIHDQSIKTPSRTPEQILKLSSLLSYMLYNCKMPTVSLDKEATMMRYYADLEQERCIDGMDLSWSADGDLEDLFIAPLLILPFLENAFKYGISEHIPKSWLSVTISVKGDDILFKIANSKDADAHFISEGEGIRKVRARLEKIYPQAHQLRIDDEGDFFVVTLQLNLSACTTAIQEEDTTFNNVKTFKNETPMFARG